MAKAGVIRDETFELICEFAAPDTKRRLILPGDLTPVRAAAYNVYKNAVGQILLDPVLAIPAAEMWLHKNPAVLTAVKQGLKESEKGKTMHLGSFAKHAD